jgi:hypothetical protein
VERKAGDQITLPAYSAQLYHAGPALPFT